MKKLFELINKNSFFRKRFPLAQDSSQLPIITISREKGSGGRIIAYQVAKKLGNQWQVYHKEIVEQIAKETNLTKKLIEEIDEKNIPLIDGIVADLFGKRYLNLSSYYKHLLKTLSAIAHRGNAIIVGRGANFLIENAFKVRVICDKEQRIKWLMEYEKFTKNQAVKTIEESDQKRVEFVKSLFQQDPREEHLYDLVIKTGEYINAEVASEIIVKLARRKFNL